MRILPRLFKKNKRVGQFNVSWAKVYEWLSNILMYPGDMNSEVIGFSNEKVSFVKSYGGIVECPIMNRVIDLTEDHKGNEVFQSMQSHELGWWKHITRKLKWEDYSKYQYHFDHQFPPILKRAGYQITDPYMAFETMLDLGCGPYGIAKMFSASRFKIGADSLAVQYSSLVPVNHTFPKIACFGERLPFKDESFEFIISTNAIDHFESWQDSLREIIRCTKSNGYIFVDVDCRTERELEELHQIPIDPEDVLALVEENSVKLFYTQVGPKRYCEKRLVFIGRK